MLMIQFFWFCSSLPFVLLVQISCSRELIIASSTPGSTLALSLLFSTSLSKKTAVTDEDVSFRDHKLLGILQFSGNEILSSSEVFRHVRWSWSASHTSHLRLMYHIQSCYYNHQASPSSTAPFYHQSKDILPVFVEQRSSFNGPKTLRHVAHDTRCCQKCAYFKATKATKAKRLHYWPIQEAHPPSQRREEALLP